MDPSSFESSHVHSVYNAIASDFSRTRHSRWPFVEQFLESLPSGSLILDAGTGNGKYLGVRSVLEWEGKAEEGSKGKGKGKGSERNDLLNVGFDMSQGLLGIASGKGHEVVRGDCVDMSCWRRGAFDHAISIATIHHFATPSRRIESIKQMILSIHSPSPPSPSSQTSPRTGRILIVVWSSEQDPSLLGARSARRTTGGKKGAIEIEPLREEEGELGKGKDVFVPWEKQAEPIPRKKKEPTPRRRNKPIATGAESTPREEEKDVSAPPTDQLKQLNLNSPASPSSALDPSPPPAAVEDPKPTFNRYYHLFTQYELSSLVRSAALELELEFECPSDYSLEQGHERAVDGGEQREWRGFVRLKEERWERENWVVEVEVGWRGK